MGTGRIEAFSDGVIAVIITIMVLDLHIPHAGTWAAFVPLEPSLLIYALSFVTIGIMWINHHHLLHAARFPTPALMWSNLLLLFAMSLIPLVTAWIASAYGASTPVAAYAIVLFAVSIAYAILSRVIDGQQPPTDGPRVAGLSRFSLKGVLVSVLYLAAIPLAYLSIAVSYGIFVLIPILYVLPDRAMARE